MAGIVQQQRECRNGATANMLAKKRGREGDPGHVFCQWEEILAIPRYGMCVWVRVRRGGRRAENQ